ncbi:c-type cytochrome, partial [Bordetella bronchialis]
MSKEQEHVQEHASLIKTPKQLIVTVVLAFLVPIIIILMLVNMVASYGRSGVGSNALTPEAIEKRIAPVAGFDLVDANAPKVFKTGEQVFSSVCMSCHAAGVAGAPKVGDNAAWAPRIKEGLEAMYNIAIHGKGAMPPKGGNPSLSDYEVQRAVVFMANKSGGNFKEPEAPAQGAAGQGQAQAAPAAAAPAPAAQAPAPA